jgi:hypothetical protein
MDDYVVSPTSLFPPSVLRELPLTVPPITIHQPSTSVSPVDSVTSLTPLLPKTPISQPKVVLSPKLVQLGRQMAKREQKRPITGAKNRHGRACREILSRGRAFQYHKRSRRFTRLEDGKGYNLLQLEPSKEHCCRVPGYTAAPLDTKDNLAAHLRTHGKPSKRRRLSYIATQDVTCDLYNPRWQMLRRS